MAECESVPDVSDRLVAHACDSFGIDANYNCSLGIDAAHALGVVENSVSNSLTLRFADSHGIASEN